jgi:hypothetical protein
LSQNDRKISRLIDSIIRDLSGSLADEDRKSGWTDSVQRRWLEHFLELRTRLEQGRGTRGDEHHLMRWLNFDGIGVGPLASKMRALQSELRSKRS